MADHQQDGDASLICPRCQKPGNPAIWDGVCWSCAALLYGQAMKKERTATIRQFRLENNVLPGEDVHVADFTVDDCDTIDRTEHRKG